MKILELDEKEAGDRFMEVRRGFKKGTPKTRMKGECYKRYKENGRLGNGAGYGIKEIRGKITRGRLEIDRKGLRKDLENVELD